jgi:uroporphyrinogen decarboxylase
VRKFIPLLIETGFDCVQPLEARQGNDVRDLKGRFGSQIALFGNISADVMSQTKAAIEEEVSTKVEAAKGGGGYIFHSDHSVPPLISFDNYCFVMEQAKKHGRQ